MDIVERDDLWARTAAEQVERGVDRRAGQIRFRVARQVVVVLAFDQAQKDGLQDVLGIRGAARNAMGSAIDAPVMRLEERLQLAGGVVDGARRCIDLIFIHADRVVID